MEKNDIINEIEELANGGSDVAYFPGLVYDMDLLEDEDIDIVLIKNMEGLKESLCIGTFDQSWRAQTGDIAEGKYPLEKLPDHVREIARELYYT
ncbi:MAG: hypothetical protein WDA74_06580 [Spirochaetota bacterium]